MPLYAFYHRSHVTERYAAMAKPPKRVRCGVCKRGWAKLGFSVNLQSFVKNRPLSEKAKKDFRHVFSKDVRKRLETSGDVENGFKDFERRYPHLGRPGSMRREPFRDLQLSDREDNYRNPGRDNPE